MMNALRCLLVSFFVALPLGAATAAEFDVSMLNKSSTGKERMVFEPSILDIQVGDTVNWLATNKGHNVEFIKGAVPEGVGKFKSSLGRDISFTFTEPGVYVYKCTPHFGMGMIGIVVVGDDRSNLEAAKDVRYPGKSKSRAAEMFDSLG